MRSGRRFTRLAAARVPAAGAGVLALGIAVALAVAPAGAAGTDLADWTAVSNNVASGTLLGSSITLSGTHVSDSPASTVNGTSPLFSSAQFTPSLPMTDAIEIRASSPAFSYTIQFGAPIQNPILDIGSLGSTVEFPAGTAISRVSGTSGFAVSGTTVTGAPDSNVDPSGENDSWGTVMLSGTFQTITFTAVYPGLDGVYIQVGAIAPPLPPPTTTTPPPTMTTPSPPTPILPTLGSRAVDLRVSGIEVTQGTQWSGCGGCEGTLPSRTPVKSLLGVVPASFATYQGVRMAAGHLTVVRVFATFTRPADLAPLRGVTARLDVVDSNGNVISNLLPDSAPLSLTKTGCWTCVTLAQRADPSDSFNFLVPWDETFHRQLSFRATVTPIRYAQSLLPIVQCSGCHANVFTLSGVPFVSTVTVPIHPIPLTVGKARNCGLPTAFGCTSQTTEQVFGDAQTVLPEQIETYPWDTPLAVDGMNNSQAAAAVAKRASDDRLTNRDYPIGVFFKTEGALANGLTTGTLYAGNGPASIVQDTGRPLTSVAHEIGHGLGLVHADTGSNCAPLPNSNPVVQSCPGPHPDGTPDCGGNSGGQPGEPWPPDNEGRLQSVGFDRRSWNIFQTGSVPSTFVEGYTHSGTPTNDPTQGARYYDFMSYCPAGGVIESLDWISQTNWNALIGFHPPAQALPAATDRHARTAQGTPLRVIATVDPAGTTAIFDVAPGQQTNGGPTPGSPYRIELRNAAGDVLTSVVPTTSSIHVDGPGQQPALLLSATMPFAPNAAAVVITANGQELASRVRSAHAPAVLWMAPTAGSRIGRMHATIVRWSAHDADGDRLAATVDYSADGGRTWKVVADNITGDTTRIANGLLAGSTNARFRVRVSDGFNVTAALSGRLRAVGAPPLVQIIGAHTGGRVLATSTILLQGVAFDDAGRQLTGARLKWYAGTRLIGRGQLLTIQRLPSGATVLTLKATDSHGRTSHAALRIQVLAPKPTLTFVRAPAKLSPRARRITITLASNVPAAFTIAATRHKINSKPRTITIPIHTGRSTLRLRYSLNSPGGIAQGTYVVSR